MNWRLASRLSVITLALLVILVVLVLQSPQNLGNVMLSILPWHPAQLQGTDLGGVAAPDFHLTDQFGQPISLSQFKGKPVILTFMYTHCTTFCPATAEKLHSVMQELGPDAQRTAVLAVSTDPKNDTPASAIAFSNAHHMLDYWHFLLGTQSTLSSVWSAYSVLAQQSNNTVIHSTGLYLIDKQGNERVFLDDDFTPAQVVSDLKILLNQ